MELRQPRKQVIAVLREKVHWQGGALTRMSIGIPPRRSIVASHAARAASDPPAHVSSSSEVMMRTVARASPSRLSTAAPSAPNLARQSAHCCSASAASGVTRTARPPGVSRSIRRIANSAQIVLPEPVGAPTSTLSSELYSVWKVCVWIGLKWVNAPE